jgi:hypothetical protein
MATAALPAWKRELDLTGDAFTVFPALTPCYSCRDASHKRFNSINFLSPHRPAPARLANSKPDTSVLLVCGSGVARVLLRRCSGVAPVLLA